MASSSDWLDALLERPHEESPKANPGSWLAQLNGSKHEPDPKHKSADGFVGGLPFGRPNARPNPEADLSGDMTGDALVDILREALGENEGAAGALHPFEAGAAVQSSAEPDAASDTGFETAPETGPETAPDPIAKAHARGLEEGRQEGKREALALHDSDAAHKLQLRQTFRALDQAAMDTLAGELAETVIALCAQTLADYTPDAAGLQARCAEAARRLGTRVSDAVLILHPDDLALLDEKSVSDWTLVGDPAAKRGGLRFETEDGSISDRPSDWRRAIAAAIRG